MYSEEESSEPSTVFSIFEEEVFTRQYNIMKTLGQGGTAKVMLAHHRLTGAPVAVKALVKQKKWCEPTVSEVDIMKMLSHPNIVSLLQVIETEKNIYLIMEVVQGKQLLNKIREAGCLKEDEARNIFVQLLSAIGYCHDVGIAHRDLKPDNIVVDEHGRVKIIDFGLGARFKPGQKLERLCGVYQFIPPEIFLGLPYDGPKVDVWTLGVLLYFMVTGILPFTAATLSELSKQVQQGRYDIPCHLSKDLRSMISLLLAVNAKQRPTVLDIMGHPWLQQAKLTLTIHDFGDTSYPDPKIMAAMENIGFGSQDIRKSLKHRKFNETMAAYHLLSHQACPHDGKKLQRKKMNSMLTPFPTPEDPATFPLFLRKGASEPSLQVLVSDKEKHHLTQRNETNAPVVPEKMPTLGRGYLKRSMTAPCIYTPKNTLMDMGDSSFSTSSLSEKALSGPEQIETSTSSSLQPRGWVAWKKRIGEFIRRYCCCCMSSHKKLPRKVCPQKCGNSMK
ncbi:sperm motility kinase Z-like [Meriones unguiculatus]|uniref:sperm motility kinase Z-like n=1 Tax=Meriones unguiculatus TaxID=10047 RepID=UPI00293E5E93|nr:sperm motility kinase Z-like [Meriones unguiculatus]